MYSEISKKIFKANKLTTIPACVNRKGPFIKNWSSYCTNTPTEEEREAWMENYPEKNICIPLGPVNNLIAIDIDFDQQENPELFESIMKILPITSISKFGSKGITLFYRYNGELTKIYYYTFDGIKRVALEILSQGKTSDIPPSIHPRTGKAYKYLGEDTFETKNIISKLPTLNSTIINQLELLFNLNFEKVVSCSSGRNDKIKNIVTAGLNKGVEQSSLLKQILTYDERHHSPPLFSDSKEFPPSSSPENNAQTFISNIKKTITSSTACDSLKVIGLEDLLTGKQTKIEWLVDELLPKRGTSLLIAGPKVGKSQLSRFLALRVADGGKFLRRKVKVGKVLIVMLEEHPSNVIDQITSLNIENQKAVTIITRQNSNNYFLDTLKYIEKEKPDLVIIDTLVKFFNCDDINNYNKVINPMSQIETVAHQNGTHIMMIHHAKKSSNGSSNDVLGSQALFASVDSLLILHKHQGVKDGKIFITTEQRYSANNFTDAPLIRNNDNLTFTVFKSLEHQKSTEMMSQIKELLTKQSLAEAKIIDQTTGKTELIKNSIRNLFDKKIITRSGKGIKTDPFIYSLK